MGVEGLKLPVAGLAVALPDPGPWDVGAAVCPPPAMWQTPALTAMTADAAPLLPHTAAGLCPALRGPGRPAGWRKGRTEGGNGGLGPREWKGGGEETAQRPNAA